MIFHNTRVPVVYSSNDSPIEWASSTSYDPSICSDICSGDGPLVCTAIVLDDVVHGETRIFLAAAFIWEGEIISSRQYGQWSFFSSQSSMHDLWNMWVQEAPFTTTSYIDCWRRLSRRPPVCTVDKARKGWIFTHRTCVVAQGEFPVRVYSKCTWT